MEIISALTFGLITGFHCIGMCGPIAIALPLINQSWFSRTLSALLYNFGRTVTYSAMGAVFGLLGTGFRLMGIQQWVSIAMGILMILSVIFPLVFRKHFQADGIISKWTSGLKSAFRKMFSKRSYSSLFVIGLINGLLPCGPVYTMAIAGAVVTGSVAGGALYMFVFGLGTIPIMLSLSLLGNMMSVKFRNIVRKIIPIVIVIIGILFILRGMNLGIKYISPKFDNNDPTKVECCH
jgi:sulfite exporter TauE/SafE